MLEVTFGRYIDYRMNFANALRLVRCYRPREARQLRCGCACPRHPGPRADGGPVMAPPWVRQCLSCMQDSSSGSMPNLLALSPDGATEQAARGRDSVPGGRDSTSIPPRQPSTPLAGNHVSERLSVTTLRSLRTAVLHTASPGRVSDVYTLGATIGAPFASPAPHRLTDRHCRQARAATP